MAKTKEKIVDLKAKAEKITDNELESLQSTIRTIDRLTLDVGRIEIQKFSVLAAMQEVQKKIDGTREDFVKKYGTDNINIQTGEIAYAPETEGNGEVNKED